MSAPKFFLIRVDGDNRDTYACPVGEGQPGVYIATVVLPDDGSTVEVAIVRATDAGAARLMAPTVRQWRTVAT